MLSKNQRVPPSSSHATMAAESGIHKRVGSKNLPSYEKAGSKVTTTGASSENSKVALPLPHDIKSATAAATIS